MKVAVTVELDVPEGWSEAHVRDELWAVLLEVEDTMLVIDSVSTIERVVS